MDVEIAHMLPRTGSGKTLQENLFWRSKPASHWFYVHKTNALNTYFDTNLSVIFWKVSYFDNPPTNSEHLRPTWMPRNLGGEYQKKVAQDFYDRRLTAKIYEHD